jgi:hypothetical protein
MASVLLESAGSGDGAVYSADCMKNNSTFAAKLSRTIVNCLSIQIDGRGFWKADEGRGEKPKSRPTSIS